MRDKDTCEAMFFYQLVGRCLCHMVEVHTTQCVSQYDVFSGLMVYDDFGAVLSRDNPISQAHAHMM